MKSEQTLPRLAALLILPWVALSGGGCGGISASPSVSPASFFLPGLVQRLPESPPISAISEQESIQINPASIPGEVAQAR